MRRLESSVLFQITLSDIIYNDLGGRIHYTPDDVLVLDTLRRNQGNTYRTAKELGRSRGAIQAHGIRLDKLALLDELGYKVWIGAARQAIEANASKATWVYPEYSDTIAETKGIEDDEG